MNRVLTIAAHEYLTNVRRPGFIIITLLIPLLGLVGLLIAAYFGAQASGMLERQLTAPEPLAVGVVDHYGAFTTIVPPYRSQFRVYGDEAAARAALAADDVQMVLIIPPDYLQTGRVAVIGNGSTFNIAMMQDSQTVRSFFVAQLTRGVVSPDLARRLAQPLDPVLVSARERAPGRQGGLGIALNMLVPYFFGLLLVITIFTSSGYLLRSVSDEKTSRVIEILLSSVSARQLLAGKIVGLGALGLTQVAVWLASTAALSGGAVGLLGVAIPLLARPSLFVLAVVYYLLGFLVYAVLMGAGGSLGTNMHEAQQVAGIFSMAAALPFMLAGFLFTNPNMLLARILSWFPLTSPTMMLLRLPMSDVPTVDIVGSIALLLLTVPCVLWAGAKVFRMGLLMYGKRPGLRQVLRALREA